MADYTLGSVVGIRIYRRDVVVIREGRPVDPPIVDRGGIHEWSKKSRLRLAFVAANTEVDFVTMITLTYPKAYPSDGKAVKLHFHTFMTWLRRDCRGPEYMWFLEFQQRGAPHFHVLLDWPLPRTKRLVKEFRFRVAANWYRIVDSHDAKHLSAGTSVERIRLRDGAARYALKYCAKMHQKWVPDEYENVGRFWGCSSNVMPQEPAMVQCTEDDIRGCLDGWDHAPDENRELYRVLYGVSSLFASHDPSMSDNISP